MPVAPVTYSRKVFLAYAYKFVLQAFFKMNCSQKFCQIPYAYAADVFYIKKCKQAWAYRVPRQSPSKYCPSPKLLNFSVQREIGVTYGLLAN